MHGAAPMLSARPAAPALAAIELAPGWGERREAASGFEPLHGGFADLSLNHLGTPPGERC